MMETGAALGLQSCSWIGRDKGRRRPGELLRLNNYQFREEKTVQAISLRDLKSNGVSLRIKASEFKVSCSSKKSEASAFGSENFTASVDEALILKRKSEEVPYHVNGQCIYLVGMMGSGKTTIGKILAEVLGYSFFDSDKLVEQSVGMSSIAQIFKERNEAFFRDSESEVLRDLSTMRRLVVATGGGAVIRPRNWKYMRHGITVWLDVPLEALARRIAAVGTASRPLLHEESGDTYSKAFTRLTTLAEQRGDAYANADAKVCLQYIAAKQGHGDASLLTPTAIAIEALIRIESFLTEGRTATRRAYNLRA